MVIASLVMVTGFAVSVGVTVIAGTGVGCAGLGDAFRMVEPACFEST